MVLYYVILCFIMFSFNYYTIVTIWFMPHRGHPRGKLYRDFVRDSARIPFKCYRYGITCAELALKKYITLALEKQTPERSVPPHVHALIAHIGISQWFHQLYFQTNHELKTRPRNSPLWRSIFYKVKVSFSKYSWRS